MLFMSEGFHNTPTSWSANKDKALIILIIDNHLTFSNYKDCAIDFGMNSKL